MKLIGHIFFLVVTVIAQGFLFMKLWLWFIVSAFPTLPTLNLNQSIGIAFVIAILKNNITKNDRDRDFDEVATDWFIGLIYIVISLLIGWGLYCTIQ